MNIVFPILSFYPSQFGGPGNTVYWLAKSLEHKSINSIVVTTNIGIKPNHNIKLNQWIPAEFGKVWFQKTRIAKAPFKALFVTLKEIKNADVLHLSSVFYPLSWLPALFNRLFYNKPLIISPRGELDPSALIYQLHRKKIVLKLYKYFLDKNVLFHATCLEEANHISRIFGETYKIVQIPNLLPIKLSSNNQKREEYLLFLGRVHPIKAIENLIRSLPLSEPFMNTNYKLLIAGKGEAKYEEYLKNIVNQLQLNEKVAFIGSVEGVDKTNILSRAHCLILPSNTENFGNVVVEALEYCTPVIASKGTPWQLLEEYKAGIWTENNAANLATAITNMLTINKEEYSQMCVNARRLVEDKFDIEKNIYQWVEVYSRLKCN